VASDGTFTDVRRVRIDAGDWVRLSRDGRRIYFSFVTRRGVDGLDFRTDAARIAFRLRINGREAAPRAEIFLGRLGRHPLNNPFVLFVKEADRDDDSVRLEFLEPSKDDVNVLDLIPGGELEEESQAMTSAIALRWSATLAPAQGRLALRRALLFFTL
jgi:hypothetical protein